MSGLGEPGTLLDGALAGERRSVARLISLIEDGASEASAVMSRLHGHTGNAYSIGVTGAPGAGKSTLTDRLVVQARSDGLAVGVLAIDPSSPFTGGALLGDRVRMQAHATDPGVFIRSMATRGHLGGISLATPEAMRVLDAAGFDVVFVETVGVGQAEVDVADACDTTLVVVTPGWGDAIQVAKAGVMEIADIFVVNKADRPGASETVRELRHMLELSDSGVRPAIAATDSVGGVGIAELWAEIGAHRDRQRSAGDLELRRRRRVEREIKDIAAASLRADIDGGLSQLVRDLTGQVCDRRLDPYEAAARIADAVRNADGRRQPVPPLPD